MVFDDVLGEGQFRKSRVEANGRSQIRDPRAVDHLEPSASVRHLAHPQTKQTDHLEQNCREAAGLLHRSVSDALALPASCPYGSEPKCLETGE